MKCEFVQKKGSKQAAALTSRVELFVPRKQWRKAPDSTKQALITLVECIEREFSKLQSYFNERREVAKYRLEEEGKIVDMLGFINP